MQRTRHFSHGILGLSCWAIVLAHPKTALSQPVSVGPQTRVDNNPAGYQAKETAIAAGSSCRVVAAWNDYGPGTGGGRLGVGWSTNAGVTWSSQLLPAPPDEPSASGLGDPFCTRDKRTGDLWVGGLASTPGQAGHLIARLNSSGTGFLASKFVKVIDGDRGTLAVGQRFNDPTQGRVYLASWGKLTTSDPLHSILVRSTDSLGQIWNELPIDLDVQLGEYVALPRLQVGASGDLYMGYHSGGNIRFARSTNNGASFSTASQVATRMFVPSPDQFNPFIPGGLFRAVFYTCMAVGPDPAGPDPEPIYMCWWDRAGTFTDSCGLQTDLDLYLKKSLDQGATWSDLIQIALPGDQFLPAIEVDGAGRIHIAYYDAPLMACGARNCDGTPPGYFNNAYAYSNDGGMTWTTCTLSTDTQPPQCPCAGSCTPRPWDSQGGGNMFGGADYIGIGVGTNRAYPCYFSAVESCDSQNPADLNIYVHAISWTLAQCAPPPGGGQ